jgi:alpha-tubulin suppressor-like RCC1 family protein
MKYSLNAGENVRHRTRSQWGIGKITSVNSCGTVRVVFEGNNILSISKGVNYLIKVDNKGNKI